MKKLSYFFMILAISCSQETIETNKNSSEWIKTGIAFTGDHFMRSFITDKNIYLLFFDKLVSIDGDLKVTEIIKFNQRPQFNPYPILDNDLFVFSENKKENGWPKDSTFFHFINVVDGKTKCTLNFSKLRSEITGSTSEPFNLDIVTINDKGRILILVPNFTDQTYTGINYDVISSSNQIQLINKNVFQIPYIKPLELETICSIGNDFYLSSNGSHNGFVYKLDEYGGIQLFNHYSMIGKPFNFLGKWHLKTYGGYYESSDNGSTWTMNYSYQYLLIKLLGNFDDVLYFSSSNDDKYCKKSINWTTDLREMNELAIGNENLGLQCYTDLHILNDYLYSLDEENALHRIKLTPTIAPK